MQLDAAGGRMGGGMETVQAFNQASCQTQNTHFLPDNSSSIDSTVKVKHTPPSTPPVLHKVIFLNNIFLIMQQRRGVSPS